MSVLWRKECKAFTLFSGFESTAFTSVNEVGMRCGRDNDRGGKAW